MEGKSPKTSSANSRVHPGAPPYLLTTPDPWLGRNYQQPRGSPSLLCQEGIFLPAPARLQGATGAVCPA